MKRIVLLLFVLLLSALALSLAGCGLFDSNGNNNDIIDVEKIQIEDSDVILATTGQFASFTLEPEVMPKNAANKQVTYSILDDAASEYFSITSNGVLTSNGKATPDDVTYKVRIKSNMISSVYLDVRVAVMEAVIKKISFETTELDLIVSNKNGVKVTPKITPYFAVYDTPIQYEILKEEVATVSTVTNEKESYALVKPVSTGNTSLRAHWGYGNNIIEGFLPIVVNYEKLNYRLNIEAEDLGNFRQMLGLPFDIRVNLFNLDNDLSDPNPEIRWYLNDSELNDTQNIKGKKNITIKPGDLNMTAGSHNIYAKLTSGKHEQILHLSTIYIYKELDKDTFRVAKITQGSNFEVGNVIQFRAAHTESYYPPDGYMWYLIDHATDEEEVLGETFPNANDSYGYLNHTLKTRGSFAIACAPIVKGIVLHSLKKVIIIGNVTGEERIGTDITGVYVDGAKIDGDYVSHIKWDALPFDTDYSVFIEDADGRNEIYKSENDTDKKYFTNNGFYVPLTFASLQDSFKFKVKTSRQNYSAMYSYTGGTISTEDYSYLDTQHFNFNNYIVTVEEFADLVNYISIFRPDDYKHPTNINQYNLDIKFAFTFDDIKDEYGSTGSSENADPIAKNVFDLVGLVVEAYCETSNFHSSSVEMGTSLYEYKLTLIYSDVMITSYLDTPETNITNYSFVSHYADNIYSALELKDRTVLPIDSLKNTLSVSTSNQLYYAASFGYKPVPVPGSAAENIYNIARDILFRINKTNMTDAQKIHAIYDFLTNEVVYDFELANYLGDNSIEYQGFYLEGVFLKGKAVCDGIAKAFNLLSSMEGIASKKINGEAGNNGHTWNITLVDGEWYLSDATWGSIVSEKWTVENRDVPRFEFQTHHYLLTDSISFNSEHFSLSKYPTPSTKAHTVYTDMQVVPGVSMLISNDDDLTKFTEDYITKVFENQNVVWFELIIADGFTPNSNSFNIIMNVLNQNGISIDPFNPISFNGINNSIFIHLLKKET